nr:SPOR domain-containing protein [Aquibacillus saliphilus]
MFAGIDDNDADQVNAIQTQQKENNGTSNESVDQATIAGNESVTIEGLDSFVIQAGVFSTKEKAEEWRQQYTDAGFPAMIWENNDEFRLFAGIYQSESSAEPLESAMIAENLDPYVRAWQTETMTIEASAEFDAWLDSFSDHWNDSITILTSEKNLSSIQSEWSEWMSNYPESDPQLGADLHVAGQQLVQSIENEDNAQLLQMDLLNLWKQVDNLGE